MRDMYNYCVFYLGVCRFGTSTETCCHRSTQKNHRPVLREQSPLTSWGHDQRHNKEDWLRENATQQNHLAEEEKLADGKKGFSREASSKMLNPTRPRPV